ncbi:MAG: restriction endonuclease subunit S [Clostridiales bacterium]|nr:restriction endonuclease subunit S [Candidatus Equinaster intestinalis]
MLSLNDREWKSFKIDSLFITETKGNIPTGSYIKKDQLKEGTVPRITVTSQNNGIDNYWIDISSSSYRTFENFISVSFLGDVFYHKTKSSIDMKVHSLQLKDRTLSECLAIFLCRALRNNTEISTYGNQLSSYDLARKSIMLPIDTIDNPDYDFMQAYVKEREQIKVERYTQYCKERFSELGRFVDIESLSSKSWGSFFIKKIFDEIERGKRLKKDDHISGDKPHVSSTSLNNGVDQFIGNENKTRVFEDCLSLANSGSVGSCFYEPFQFVASDHVTHLKKYDTSKYIYLFMATMLNRLSEKYNFNREINDSRISREKILLPITEAGEPDYDYMEQYVKNMIIQKYQQYLDYYESKKNK